MSQCKCDLFDLQEGEKNANWKGSPSNAVYPALYYLHWDIFKNQLLL